MSLHDRLVCFIEQKLEDGDAEIPGGLDDRTSLVASGLLDSVVLLELAAWIEQELDTDLDMTALDLPDAWDTISSIVDFIEGGRAGSRA